MNVYILNTLIAGIDTINSLKNHIKIKGIIGLAERESDEGISGYIFMRKFCKENGFDFIPVQTYGLKNESDRKRLESLELDTLLVLGWQRLIPSWLIKKCKICAIGVHGSPYGITMGRGRSPQNWALMLGKKKFHISIFRIDEGIDSGDIIDTATFELDQFDDIKSSYHKVGILTSAMIVKNIKNRNIESKKTIPQKKHARYLPQRIPEDGAIDWKRNTTEIHNFVRALSHPYPGAFSRIMNSKIIVWRTRPFKIQNNSKFKAGQIVKIFVGGDLLIQTGNGFLLIESYSTVPDRFRTKIKAGMILESVNFKNQIKSIIKRHYEKYPNNKLHNDIIKLTK